MNSDLIFKIILVISQAIVVFFFIQERKSKNRIIDDLKTLMDTTDIKRLSKYFKEIDNLREKNAIAKTELLVNNWFKEQNATMGNQFDELASFAASLIQGMNSDEQKLFIIKQNFPSCLPLFQKYLSDQGNKVPDNDNNEKV